MSTEETEIVCEGGGWWPPEQQSPDGWGFERADMLLTLDAADGCINVTLNDGEGFEATALCAIPVAAIAALLAKHVGSAHA